MAKHVLVVDDDPLIGQFLVDVLDGKGFTVTVARNGKEGLEAARSQKPDLILLDVMMPELNGFQVCEALRRDAALEATPVVMLTAMENQKLNELAFEAGAEVCMTKPFQPDRLINIISLAIDNAARKRPVTKPVPE
jgi:two-component system, OmpR family, alkaline phosphatase synthesis response regulator PhoP